MRNGQRCLRLGAGDEIIRTCLITISIIFQEATGRENAGSVWLVHLSRIRLFGNPPVDAGFI
jgi:hypothetical protein